MSFFLAHTAAALRVPPTLHRLPLPPYSPELNPVEHIWDHLRENYNGNHVFSSLDAVVDQVSAGPKVSPTFSWQRGISP